MGYTGTNISGCNSPTIGNDKSTYGAAFDAAMAALDAHDHSSNKGLPIDTAGLSDLSVTTGKIANAAVTSAKLAAAVAGAGLAGGAGSALSVNVDGTTIVIDTDTLGVPAGGIGTTQLADASVTAAKLAAAVAGDGLAGGAGTALSVNVDGSTIVISADTLGVPTGGIGTTQIAANAVTTAKILDANVTTAKIADGAVTSAKLPAGAVTFGKLATGAVGSDNIVAQAIDASKIATSVAGAGLAGGGGTVLSVNVDGSSIEISSDTLRVKAGGITQAMLATKLDGSTIGAGGIAKSDVAETGAYTSASVVTHMTVTLTTTGRPVRIQFQGANNDAEGEESSISLSGNSTYTDPNVVFQIKRGSTFISGGAFAWKPKVSTNSEIVAIPASCFSCLDLVAAGTYTYTVIVFGSGDVAVRGRVTFNNVILVAYEI